MKTLGISCLMLLNTSIFRNKKNSKKASSIEDDLNSASEFEEIWEEKKSNIILCLVFDFMPFI